MITIEIKAPYLIFLGEETDRLYAKTGSGMVDWRPELCKGQLSLIEDGLDLGLPKLSIEEAVEAGVKSFVIGTASVGGGIPDQWLDVMEQALDAGLDIVGGVHKKLNDIPRLVDAAEKSGARLVDVRVPPQDIPVGSGKKRSGKRILMVGTDCAVGKKYTALALERDMKKAGLNADFCASGQTGIMIAGRGIPIDAVVADFLSGAAELLSADNDPDHWDVIEGQGGIFHPGYSSVSMGLLIGSQPDAFIVCHEAGRKEIGEWEGFPVPTIEQVIDRTVAIGSLTNPNIKCVGVSVNTSMLDGEERTRYLKDLSARVGLPCVDPLIDGTEAIIHNLR
tara:strand:- start:17577 stop:18584 length:1008 start_codon:yes stop_codon:yes gene_type:complete